MSWNAKPSGAYGINSDEAKENMIEIYNMLKQTWTIQAISGMIGNMVYESGLNPWRWQGDAVSLTDSKKGYGLPQFTPAYGYINDYGKDVEGYSPNLSTSEITQGASPNDGKAQIIVIDTDKAGKFINRQSYCTYADISSCYPMSDFKQVNDLYIATVGWLFNYEFPADHSQSVAQVRYEATQTVYEILKGQPTPPIPTTRKKMPVWMMCRRI